MIVEMNMSLKEIGYYSKRLTHNMVMPDSISSKNAKRDMPAFEDLRKLEQKMHNDYDIEYWLMDLISPNYDRLLKLYFLTQLISSVITCHTHIIL